MNWKPALANITRWLARIGSIVLILLGLASLLVGAGIATSSSDAELVIALLFFPSLCLVGMLAGLVIAWWKERLGAAITLVSSVSAFFTGRRLPDTAGGLPFSMLPFFTEYVYIQTAHGDMPETVRIVSRWISWVLPLVTVLLFIISWLLRRKLLKIESRGGMSTGEERRDN